MKVLVMNTGSSSVKAAIIDTRNNKELFKKNVQGVKSHEKAIKEIVKELEEKELLNIIDAVGHRIVHGGEKSKECYLNDKTIKKLEKLNSLAPLHNPYNLLGVKISKKYISKPHIAVFDTSFHSSMPVENRIYAIPLKYYKKGIKRYGFHGISHEYLYREAVKIVGKKKRIITCHIGSGASITAIRNGKSIINSMGYTPFDGLIMSTRSGSIDPGIVLELVKMHGLRNARNVLCKESGWYGLSGKKDYRDLKKDYLKRRRVAIQTIEIMANDLAQFISGYIPYLRGLDCIVFSGGIGENDPIIREKVVERLRFLGIKLDKKANKENKTIISTKDSSIKVLVIPTNEELMIARKVERFLKKFKNNA